MQARIGTMRLSILITSSKILRVFLAFLLVGGLITIRGVHSKDLLLSAPIAYGIVFSLSVLLVEFVFLIKHPSSKMSLWGSLGIATGTAIGLAICFIGFVLLGTQIFLLVPLETGAPFLNVISHIRSYAFDAGFAYGVAYFAVDQFID